MKIDSGLGGIETAAERARVAEAEGYAGVWTGETNSDAFLALTLAASATSTIDLGTDLIVALARSPMMTAYTTHELQRFSRGRLHLGLGSQVKAHITRRFDMKWGRPAPQMRDYINALHAIWSAWDDGTPLAFESEHYRFTLMTPNFTPPANPYGSPPVLLAGVGPAMTRVAGEVADGFLCHGFTTARYLREVTWPALEEGARRVGRTLDAFELVGTTFVATGTDAEIAAALPEVRRRIAFYASTPAYRGVLDVHGWGDVGAELTELSKQGRWAEMGELVDDDMVAAFAVVGPPADVPRLIAERFGGVLTRLMFVPPDSLDADEAAELLAGLRAVPGRGES